MLEQDGLECGYQMRRCIFIEIVNSYTVREFSALLNHAQKSDYQSVNGTWEAG